MVLEQEKVPRVLISQIYWKQVEQSCPMYSKGSFPGCFTFVVAFAGMLVGMANLPLLSLHCHSKE